MSPGHGPGLSPAFRDVRDGETHLARHEDGSLADVHLFHHLPARWIVQRDVSGRPVALHPAVVAGYRRGADFHPVGRRDETLPLDG